MSYTPMHMRKTFFQQSVTKLIDHPHQILIGFILLVALILRIWGANFGLPYLYHFDERFYVNTAGKLGSGVLWYSPYAPTGLSNVLFICYSALFIIGRITGHFTSAQEFMALYRTDPTVFYLTGRLINALLGTMTVFFIYKLGKLVSKPPTALLAAGFLAVAFLHVRDSHFAVPDITMSAFIIISFTIAVLGMQLRRIRYIYFAGLLSGLAVAMKWTSLPSFLPIIICATVVSWERQGARLSTQLFKNIIITCASFFLGFALGSPQILINPTPYIDSAKGQYTLAKYGGFYIWQVDTLPGWLFYGKTLFYGIGLAMLMLGLIGMVLRLVAVIRKSDLNSVLLLSFPLLYFILMGSTPHYFSRYMLPVIPFLALFSAEAILFLAGFFGRANKYWQYGIITLLGIIVVVEPFANSIRLDMLLLRPDTRTLAKDWIENNIPDGEKIALEYEVHVPWLATPDKPAPRSRRTYEALTMEESGLADHTLEWYRNEEYRYLIASSFIYEVPLVDEQKNAARTEFYRQLDRDLELIQEFKPYSGNTAPPFNFDEIYGPLISLWQRENPGPTIKIYRVNEEAE